LTCGRAAALLAALALAGCSRDVPREPVLREPPVAIATSSPPPPPSSPSSPSSPPSSSGEGPVGATVAPAPRLVFVAPPADADLGAFLRTERLRAKAAGRLLVVYAGASWCPPCKRFHAAAHAGELDADLGSTTLVELDADGDQVRLGALGYIYKNIPYFAVPSENGRAGESLAVVDTTQGAQRQIVDTLTRWQAAR
jgi:thiol-disulfide isomerase/thioredoxin